LEGAAIERSTAPFRWVIRFQRSLLRTISGRACVAIVPAVGKTVSANSVVANGVESRLSNPTRSVVRGSVIVVDANLSGHQSILNLFAEGGRSADRLTPLDTAYGMNQAGKIATVMAEELER
jgi:nitrogen fixation/metabolism regulation signal transduction histidine kinase